MGAATHHTTATTNIAGSLKDVGTAFRGVAQKSPTTLKDIGSTISTTLTEAPKKVGDKITSMPENILNIPIARDVSLPGLGKAIQKGDTDSLSKALGSITGVSLGDIVSLPQGASAVNVEKRVDDYMAAIKVQILNEIKACIEKCINKLVNEHPIIGILLDLEGYIQRRISKYRLELQRKIRAEIEKIAFQKLKLWQIALLRQKILEYVRKACPCDSIKGDTSPTYIKRLQDDTSWKLLDGSTDVEVLLAGDSPNSVAWSGSSNNTARSIDAIIVNAITQVKGDATIQSLGYNNSSWDDFVDDDGNIARNYINVDGNEVDSLDVNSIKRLEICDD